MKKGILLISVIALIAGCSLIPFYTDKNNIMEFIPDIEENSIYTYEYHTYSIVEYYDSTLGEWLSDTTDTSYEMSDTCREKEMTENKSFFLFKHTPGLVFIKDRGIAAITYDSLYIEEEDFVFLKTPVQVESDWVCDSQKIEIKRIGEIYKKNEIKVEDVIVVEIVYDIDALGNVYRIHYSPSKGIVKEYNVINDNGDMYAYTKELLRISRVAE